MILLGIMPLVNSTAALMIDGEIIACCCEDRFTRQKSIAAYPLHAIHVCLEIAGIPPNRIDKVILPYKGMDLSNPTRWVTNYDATFSMEDKIKEQREFFYPLLMEGKDVDFYEIFKNKVHPERLDIVKRALREETDFIEICMRDHLAIGNDQIVRVDHHISHLHYAIMSNPSLKDPSLIFCMEGYGGDYNGSVSTYRDGKVSMLYGTPYCWIGRLYRYITLLLGMKSNEHEYKVMGLAPYASEYDMKQPLEIFRKTAYIDGLEIKFRHKPKDIYFYFKEQLEPYRFDAIAGALQRYTEEIINQWVSNGIKKTGIRDVMFSGGVAMNIKAMMEVSKLNDVDSLWVGGTSSDESQSMGALFYYNYQNHLPNKKLNTLYLGKEFSNEQLQSFISDKNLAKKYNIIKNPREKETARLIADGKILARFSGREEFGARALGNRSILANPAYPDIIRIINKKIKNRDFWMPFAPVIIDEREKDYLINEKNILSPYMTIGFETTEPAKKFLKGALHPFDFTARPQILKKRENPSYYRLIKAFEELTGIGGLLNTSFNLHGEPIVHTPDDAVYVFENTQIDMLLLGNNLILKT